MKPGLKIGQTAEIEITVNDSMRPTFEGAAVHDLYSTYTLVHHMEWAARKTILPYLENNEHGIGYHVEVSHLALTLPGMKVRIKATVSDYHDNKVTCDVEAYNSRGKIARGAMTQAIVDKAWLERKMKELSLIHQLSQNAEPAGR